MAYVITKRPADVLEHDLDFTGYLPDGQSVASAVVLVKGEVDNLLTATEVVASPLVKVTLSGGTARGIYQVYVTATFGDTPAHIKRLQFEVQMTGADEGN